LDATCFQRIGEIVKPTIMSRAARACCAFTIFILRVLGFIIAFVTAVFVISLNDALFVFIISSPSSIAIE
jgi:hypothetical protein